MVYVVARSGAEILVGKYALMHLIEIHKRRALLPCGHLGNFPKPLSLMLLVYIPAHAGVGVHAGNQHYFNIRVCLFHRFHYLKSRRLELLLRGIGIVHAVGKYHKVVALVALGIIVSAYIAEKRVPSVFHGPAAHGKVIHLHLALGIAGKLLLNKLVHIGHIRLPAIHAGGIAAGEYGIPVEQHLQVSPVFKLILRVFQLIALILRVFYSLLCHLRRIVGVAYAYLLFIKEGAYAVQRISEAAASSVRPCGEFRNIVAL